LSGKELLRVENLVKYFPVMSRGILLRKQVGSVHAVDDVTFSVEEGKTLALVGESGSGKTTTAKVILNLEPPTSGKAFFDGEEIFEIFNSRGEAEQLALRRQMQLIFQNPYSSLDPRMTVFDIISEPFHIHGHVSKEKITDAVYELLRMVGLEEYHAERYPHEFSGGQRQRICIARSLAVQPKFIIADEPVSSLDVSIRAQILNLLSDLQSKLGLTYLYISHDLSSVRQISHKVAVMYLGKIVEFAETDELFNHRIHPYTQALVSAVPIPDPKTKTSRIILEGEIPSPINPPPGCRFNTRCAYATDLCKEREPPLEETGKDHLSACHYSSRFY
jgi:oligopeptide/dipeptide ABC transporter ATP-binding protein